MSAWELKYTLPFGRWPLGHMASTLVCNGNHRFVATKVWLAAEKWETHSKSSQVGSGGALVAKLCLTFNFMDCKC